MWKNLLARCLQLKTSNVAGCKCFELGPCQVCPGVDRDCSMADFEKTALTVFRCVI